MRREQNPCDPLKPRFRFGRIILYVFLSALFLLLVAVLFNIVLTRKQGEPASVFGYSIITLTAGSTDPATPPGTAILVRRVAPNTLQVGDVVVFQGGYASDGKPNVDTQRIVAVGEKDGKPSFQVKGESDGAKNRVLSGQDIIGESVLSMPAVGKFFSFLKTPVGLVSCIAVPLVLLLLFEIFNLIRLSRRPDPFEEEDAPRQRKALAANGWGKRALEPEEEPEETEEPFVSILAPAPASPGESGQPAFPRYSAAAPPPPARDFSPGRVRVAARPVWQPGRPLSDDAQAARGEGPSEFSANQALYNLDIPTEREEIPLEQVTETIGSLSYHRPAAVREDASELYVTQEFVLPPDAEPSNGQPIAAALPPVPAGGAGAAPSREETIPEFEASMAMEGRDCFKIEGIHVRVKPDALKLMLTEEQKDRDISITVTREYTNVTVGSAENEVHFALFRDDDDGEQKVIIQKKNK